MSMKITRIRTYWSPDQACEMMELLDQLRDELWETYGDQIIAYRLNETIVTRMDEQQQSLDLDDEPF
jgi:hypothetical protein